MTKKKLLIKVCGMRDPVNIMETAFLNPDLMGFILYKRSARYISMDDISNIIGSIPSTIIKVGVLVNEPPGNAFEIARSGLFDYLQLHGNESPDYCREISQFTGIIKSFGVKDSLPDNLDDYVPFCRLFLFDSPSVSFGGSGKKFNHGVLPGYSADKEFLLSGGISPEDADYLRLSDYKGMKGVDINSRFETEPGIKNVGLIEKFIKQIRSNEGPY